MWCVMVEAVFVTTTGRCGENGPLLIFSLVPEVISGRPGRRAVRSFVIALVASYVCVFARTDDMFALPAA